MNSENYFSKVKNFLEEEQSSHKVIKHLKNKTEIGIIIEGLECAYFSKDNAPAVEMRKANNADVIFSLSPEAVDILSQMKNKTVGELGVEILKQYLAGGVKIKVAGPLTNFLTKGYLGIAKEGGAEFAQFLSTQGITGLAKWSSIISKMKKH